MHKYALLVGVAVLLVAADAKDDEVKKELKKFEGNWVLVSGEQDGEKIADEHVKKSKITWKDKDVVAETPHQSKDPIKGSITIDPNKKPKEMDWVRSAGPEAGKTFHAIYEFIDDDQYRVCFAP